MEIATFRFGVIADFVTGQRFVHGEKQRLLKEKSERHYNHIPGSSRTRIAKGTILSWVRIYQTGGGRIESLMPQERGDKGNFKAIPLELQQELTSLRRTSPDMTLPVMLQKIGAEKLKDVHLSTLYRFLSSLHPQQNAQQGVDRRRFEAELPNQMWQCDVMHGPLAKASSGPMKKSYLIAIMDDHSRLVVHAQFYFSENLESLKDCLRRAVQSRGLPQKFYADNGACYRAGNLEECLASLGVSLVHSRPYVPQGRGKIERWFRYVRSSFLPLHADRPLPLEVLNERLYGWVDKYNETEHGTTKMAPYDRFRKDMSCVRAAPESLMSYFRTIERRKVRKDRTVQLNNVIYEAPLGLIDKPVELHFHAETPEEIEVFFEKRSYGNARKLDSQLNGRLGRGDLHPKRSKAQPQKAQQSKSRTQSGELFGGE